MSDIQFIEPSARIPLSNATVHGGLVYVSGQVGFKPGTMQLVSDDVADQCRQVFAHIDRILTAAGSAKGRIIRCGVFLQHVERDFPIMNECYSQWLGEHRPARTTVGANFALPGILVEIDCIAAI
jgi:2-iminobutanoate/2-iminopropanoate deaminase